MCVPNASSGQVKPPTGWPIVIFQHGITANRTSVLAIAEPFAQAGIVAIAIDLPLHGLTVPFDPTKPSTYLYASSANPFYAGLGLPASGSIERTFDLDTLNNTTLAPVPEDRKSTRLNSSHSQISYAVFCLKKKKAADPRPLCR